MNNPVRAEMWLSVAVKGRSRRQYRHPVRVLTARCQCQTPEDVSSGAGCVLLGYSDDPTPCVMADHERDHGWPPFRSHPLHRGLKVGYRWYDANNISPLFPFGYGLTYTRFAFDHLAVTPASASGDPVTVSVNVTNTGSRAGSDVVQAYVGDPPAVNEPPRQLKGISKVALAPGETKRVTMQLDARSLSHWDSARGQWVASPGDYKIWVGDSSRDLPLERAVTLTREVVTGTPPPARPPNPPGQVSTNLNAALTCPEDVVAPLLNGALSLLSPLPGR
jgi:beta-glucosidase